MVKHFVNLVFLIVLTSSVFSQPSPYPQGYFRWPVDLKPEIVANLGELRPNHWHMGLDVRTNAKVNQRVFAAAEGYIAYVGIRPQSFGRFIIINHPNGLSTLYAHLNTFEPGLEEYVTQQQYLQESWAVELDIPRELFPVKKGSFISYSGTTGGSQGPHVHFEIRDTRSGKCLNPLLFGFPLPDNVPPVIFKMAIYDRASSIYKAKPVFFSLKKTGNGYSLASPQIIRTGFTKWSIGIQSIDRITGSSNQDGIYSADLFLDGQLQVGFKLDSIGYAETGYMNAHIDYPFRENGGAYIQHLTRLPGDRGGVYHPAGSDGVIELSDTSVHEVRIEVRDARRNLSIVEFKIQRKDELTKAHVFDALSFLPGQVNIMERSDVEFYLPETCLYDTVSTFYYRSNPASANAISALHQLNEPTIPIQGRFTVRVKANQPIPPEWTNKILLQRSFRKSIQYRPASLQRRTDGDWLSAEFGDFGNFRAFTDLVPPGINSLGSADTVNLSASSRILFTPTDNYGVKSFRAELDGKWLRFTNDKSRNWIYIFDERCPYGVHELKVTVTDLVGNVTSKTWWFRKNPYKPPVRKAVNKKPTIRKKTTKKK